MDGFTNRMAPAPHEQRRVIPSTEAQAVAVLKQVVADAESVGYSKENIFAIRLALDEALANAIRHGNAGDASKSITIEWRIEPKQVHITVEDQGVGFTPDDVPDPTAEENLTRPCGRGVMLMKAYMTEVRFNPTGNRVTLVKDLDTTVPDPAD